MNYTCGGAGGVVKSLSKLSAAMDGARPQTHALRPL
jgi:hypothetical protein